MAERSPPRRWRDTHYTGAGLIDLPINYGLQLPKKISCSHIPQIVARNITTTRLCDFQNTVPHSARHPPRAILHAGTTVRRKWARLGKATT